MFDITDVQKIGVGLAGFGVFFLFLGVILLFDRGLLAIGNILFVAGLAAVIGFERTFRFFFQRHKTKASIAFFGGIAVILYGWAFVGTILELYGFILLFSLGACLPWYPICCVGFYCLQTWIRFVFWLSLLVTEQLIALVALNKITLPKVFLSGFFPVAVNFLRRVPVLGTLLNMPGISGVVDRLAGDSGRTTV